MRRSHLQLSTVVTLVVTLNLAVPARAEGPATDAPPVFLRGDVDGDGVHQVNDAIVTLRYLFQGGESPACLAAADTNDDETLDLADPLVSLVTLFQSGAPLPEPSSAPGPDPTPGIGCDGSFSIAQDIVVTLHLDLSHVGSVSYHRFGSLHYARVWVRNNGSVEASGFYVDLQDLYTGQTLTRLWYAQGVPAYTSRAVWLLLPWTSCGSETWYRVRIDPTDVMSEYNENNNDRYILHVREC